MTHAPQPSPDPFQAPPPTPPPSRRRSIVWLVALGMLLGVGCCGGLCLVPLGLGVYQAATERDDVEQVLNAFLQDLDQRRFDDALGRFSSRARQTVGVSRDHIELLVNDPNFRGASRATVTNIQVSRRFNTDETMPQGVVAIVSGSLAFEPSGSGTFEATLEKEASQWRLHSIHVTGPPSSSPPPAGETPSEPAAATEP